MTAVDQALRSWRHMDEQQRLVAVLLIGVAHLPPSLLRLSVGIEHVEDLWADLDTALRECLQG